MVKMRELFYTKYNSLEDLINDGRSEREWDFYELLKSMPEVQIRFIDEKKTKGEVPDIEVKFTHGIAYFEIKEIMESQVGAEPYRHALDYGTWEVPECFVHIGKRANDIIKDYSKKFEGLEEYINAFVIYVPFLKTTRSTEVSLMTKPSQRKSLLGRPLSPTPVRVPVFEDAPVDFILLVESRTNKIQIEDNKNRNKPDIDKIKAEIVHIFS